MAVKTIFLKATNQFPYQDDYYSFQIPNDFSSLVSVEAIGRCGGPRQPSRPYAQPGGAYAKTTSITGLTAGQTVYYLNQDVGINGVTWFSTTTSAPTNSSQGVKAVGGGQNTGGGGPGGAAANCIGSTTYSGGNAYLGGGGAGGPNGAGGAGGGYNFAGGGGANGGGNSQSSNVGGNNRQGFGGGIAAPNSSSNAGSGVDGGGGGAGFDGSYASRGGNGSQDSVWTQSSNGELAGPGGGGGWSYYVQGGDAAGYGAGGGDGGTGGAGTKGIIVFTYNAIDPTITITSQPQNKTVITGEAATFSITATIDLAGYSLNYQWQKAESTDPYTWTNITGATSSSYTTGLAEAGYSSAATDGDKYRCVLGVGGTSITAVSDAAILTVIKGGNFFMMF